MRVTIVREDNIVGVDGVFRHVDLSTFPATIRAVQWNGTRGHLEYEDSSLHNYTITSIEDFRPYLDLWQAAEPPEPPEPTAEERIAYAHYRINTAYSATVQAITAGYPQAEIDSWTKQEEEARAWLKDNASPTPWIDGAAASRGITKETLVSLIIANADALAPIHGALTGKRQSLRDAIDALGSNPSQEQLDSIIWE